MTSAELMLWVKGMSADSGCIDILVEDVKCRQAIAINRQGPKGQIEYLLKHYKPETLQKLIRHEQNMLSQFGMRSQSKCEPEKNIKQKKRRK